ncbi:hypothetical protein V8E51_011759 [Hyaloscypha variabilis]
MSGSRTYTLPRNSYSGTVSGVTVSYNSGTLSAMEGIENEGLKTAMEDIVIRAALERGFTSVVIRSIPHSWTVNRYGDRVNDALHITITAGSNSVTGHIYCSGLNPRASPSHWYDHLRGDYVKWSDRATSSNASSPYSSHGQNTPPAGGTQSSSTADPQWVPTGSSVPGQQYRWWNGTEYTNDFY